MVTYQPFKLTVVCWLCSTSSLMDSEILAQLKKLSNGTALIHQDVDAQRLLQLPEVTVNENEGDDTANNFVQPHGQPLASGLVAQDTTALSQGTSWAEELDVHDP